VSVIWLSNQQQFFFFGFPATIKSGRGFSKRKLSFLAACEELLILFLC
jgi:hypothetical protein